MKKKLFLPFLILFSISNLLVANDTLRVMHYNLMYYDNYTSVDVCNASTNNVDLKDGYLSNIINYYKPDIFTANEINSSVSSVQRILTNTLNINGIDYYRRGNFTGNDISNMLYYNSNKLALKSQTYILTEPRVTDVYRLYYKPELTNHPLDTIFLTCFVIHPKAGSTAADRDRRTNAATLIMNYITNNNLQGNVMLMGDLNIYYSTEGSFVKYTTPTSTGFRFNDPINMVGYWNNNGAFSSVHTQSTHTSGACFASGGMDDRFDFILTSTPLLQENNNLSFLAGSYWAMGQDGNRFNGSLISPSNTSLPANIINSLYNMSDHLPVTLKLLVNQQTSIINTTSQNSLTISINNPVSDYLSVSVAKATPSTIKIELFDILGNRLHSTSFLTTESNPFRVSVSHLPKGLYLVKASSGGRSVVKKFIKQ
jgi:hypothetical protein